MDKSLFASFSSEKEESLFFSEEKNQYSVHLNIRRSGTCVPPAGRGFASALHWGRRPQTPICCLATLGVSRIVKTVQGRLAPGGVQRQSLCPPEAILPDFQAITVKKTFF
jgi:hypothetical protein